MFNYIFVPLMVLMMKEGMTADANQPNQYSFNAKYVSKLVLTTSEGDLTFTNVPNATVITVTATPKSPQKFEVKQSGNTIEIKNDKKSGGGNCDYAISGPSLPVEMLNGMGATKFVNWMDSFNINQGAGSILFRSNMFPSGGKKVAARIQFGSGKLTFELPKDAVAYCPKPAMGPGSSYTSSVKMGTADEAHYKIGISAGYGTVVLAYDQTSNTGGPAKH